MQIRLKKDIPVALNYFNNITKEMQESVQLFLKGASFEVISIRKSTSIVSEIKFLSGQFAFLDNSFFEIVIEKEELAPIIERINKSGAVLFCGYSDEVWIKKFKIFSDRFEIHSPSQKYRTIGFSMLKEISLFDNVITIKAHNSLTKIKIIKVVSVNDFV